MGLHWLALCFEDLECGARGHELLSILLLQFIQVGIYQKVHTLMQFLPIKYVLYNG